MIEAVADMDDELTHKYLEGEELTIAEIKRRLRLGPSRRGSSAS